MENWTWTANVKITVRDLSGEVIDVTEFHNLIVTIGLNMLRNFLAGTIADGKIKYMGVGNDGTPPVIGNIWLGNEVFRKALTSDSLPADGQYQTIFYLAPADAVGWIREFGWFCGATAGAGFNTGIMISRVLYSRDKTSLESIEIRRDDRIAGV